MCGEQLYIERDAEGRERAATTLPVRFRLYEPSFVEQLARAAGLELREQFGGYESAAPPSSTSRVRISSFSKRR